MPRKKREPDPFAETTMTVAQAAKALGIGKQTAYRGVESGEIPSIRIGRVIKIPSAKIAEMLGIPYTPTRS